MRHDAKKEVAVAACTDRGQRRDGRRVVTVDKFRKHRLVALCFFLELGDRVAVGLHLELELRLPHGCAGGRRCCRQWRDLSFFASDRVRAAAMPAVVGGFALLNSPSLPLGFATAGRWLSTVGLDEGRRGI